MIAERVRAAAPAFTSGDESTAAAVGRSVGARGALFTSPYLCDGSLSSSLSRRRLPGVGAVTAVDGFARAFFEPVIKGGRGRRPHVHRTARAPKRQRPAATRPLADNVFGPPLDSTRVSAVAHLWGEGGEGGHSSPPMGCMCANRYNRFLLFRINEKKQNTK